MARRSWIWADANCTHVYRVTPVLVLWETDDGCVNFLICTGGKAYGWRLKTCWIRISRSEESIDFRRTSKSVDSASLQASLPAVGLHRLIGSFLKGFWRSARLC